MLVSCIAVVGVLIGCGRAVSADASSSHVVIEIGSGVFWAFVAALAAVASVITEGVKKLAPALPALLSAAVTSGVVVGAVAAINWVSLIPPGIGSWLGLWLMTYLSSCGMFDTATLKGLIPHSAGGTEE